MSKKANVIEAKGTIFKESGNGYFNVELEEPEGHSCLCRASGKLITRKIQLLVGDRVTVELSPYDLTRGCVGCVWGIGRALCWRYCNYRKS